MARGLLIKKIKRDENPVRKNERRYKMKKIIVAVLGIALLSTYELALAQGWGRGLSKS